MKELILELPGLKHKNSAIEMKAEFLNNGETVINGSALFDQLEFNEWLEHNAKSRDPETVPENWVVASTFFAVRKSDQKIIGMVDVRHNLENEFLKSFGGHVGIAVRPSERKNGYAKKIMGLALAFSKSIGLEKVMLGCYADNTPSNKLIVSCGGKLTETKMMASGNQVCSAVKPINIYWIEV